MATLGQEPLPKLPPTKVEGQPTPGAVPEVPPVDFPAPPSGPSIINGGVFGSPATSGYRADSATTGTIVDVPLIDFPGVVTVVPIPLIQDQQALRIDDILRDISAANKLGDFRRPDNFTLRGFEVDVRDFRKNGFRDPTETPRDFANVQRIEVLKGPASILYGSGQPAGVVNLITKRPLDVVGNAFDFQFGSFDLRRTTADVTGPMDENGQFLMRVNFAYENRDGFRDFYFNERTFVAPAFSWVPDEDTLFTIEYEYLTDRRRLDAGVVVLDGVLGLPINRFLGEPNDFQRFQDHRVTAWFIRRLGDDAYFRIGGYGLWNDNSFADTSAGTFGAFSSGFGPLAPIILATPSTLIRQREDTPVFDNQYYSMISDLAFKVCTGPVAHNVVLGTELGWYHDEFSSSASALFDDVLIPFPPFFLLNPTAPIDVLNPVYGGAPPALINNPALSSDIRQQLYGFYLQDLIDINEHWKVLLGGRYDIARTKFTRESNFQLDSGGFLPPLSFPQISTETHDYRLSPRAGVVYQPLPDELAFYFSYSQSFDALTGTFSRSPEPLDPETGESYEIGMKADMLDRRLSLIVAGFHITRQNVVALDNSTLFTTQVGEQRSQGVEMSLIGWVTDSLQLVGNYAYIDSRITEDALASRVGTRFRGVPYNGANIWARYNLIDNCRQTLGVALGTVYEGDREGDIDNTFELPSYVRWDGGLFYRRGPLNAALYLENIFDRQYYVGSVSNVSVFPGAPITARALVGLTF